MKGYVFTTVYDPNTDNPLATVAMPIVPLLRLKHGGVGVATVHDMPIGGAVRFDHEGEFDPRTEADEVTKRCGVEIIVYANGDIDVTAWTQFVKCADPVDTSAGWDGPSLCFVVPKDGDSIVLDISTLALRNELIGIGHREALYRRLLELDSSIPAIEDIHSVDIELSHSIEPEVDNTVNIWEFP